MREQWLDILLAAVRLFGNKPVSRSSRGRRMVNRIISTICMKLVLACRVREGMIRPPAS